MIAFAKPAPVDEEDDEAAEVAAWEETADTPDGVELVKEAPHFELKA